MKLKLISVLLSVILLCSLLSSSLLAHEVFVYSGTPVVLTFNSRNETGGPALRIYYGNLRDNGPAKYYDSAIRAMQSWDGIGQKGITVSNENQSQMFGADGRNITIKALSSVWSEYGMDAYTLGFTVLQDTNFNEITSAGAAASSTKIISEAFIYLNPSNSIFFLNTTNDSVVNARIDKTIAHEIGHAIGLGHPDAYNPISSSTYSLMRQGFPDQVRSGTVPQNHEKQDIYDKYK